VWRLADEEQQEEQVEEVEQEEQQQEEQQQEEQQLDSIGGSSRYLYPASKGAGRWAGVCAPRAFRGKSKPWTAILAANYLGGNPIRYLGRFSTERAAAEAYADAFEEQYCSLPVAWCSWLGRAARCKHFVVDGWSRL
jgi:hypothetical protein